MSSSSLTASTPSSGITVEMSETMFYWETKRSRVLLMAKSMDSLGLIVEMLA